MSQSAHHHMFMWRLGKLEHIWTSFLHTFAPLDLLCADEGYTVVRSEKRKERLRPQFAMTPPCRARELPALTTPAGFCGTDSSPTALVSLLCISGVNCANSYYTANLKDSNLSLLAILLSHREVLYLLNTFGLKDGTRVESHSSVLLMRVLVIESSRSSLPLRNKQLIIYDAEDALCFFFSCCMWIMYFS